jgi:hypothetical protein
MAIQIGIRFREEWYNRLSKWKSPFYAVNEFVEGLPESNIKFRRPLETEEQHGVELISENVEYDLEVKSYIDWLTDSYSHLIEVKLIE